MKYIPTITGRSRLHLTYDVALCSPSRKRSAILRGKDLTIVDCHTFYLRKKRNLLDSLDHYLWYCRFAAHHSDDPSLVFVAPDADWIGYKALKVIEAWPLDVPVLAVPGTHLFSRCTNIVGHAFVPNGCRVPHPLWVHHFSSTFEPLVEYSGFQSYDSVSPA